MIHLPTTLFYFMDFENCINFFINSKKKRCVYWKQVNISIKKCRSWKQFLLTTNGVYCSFDILIIIGMHLTVLIQHIILCCPCQKQYNVYKNNYI